jgi:hypothetical protein
MIHRLAGRTEHLSSNMQTHEEALCKLTAAADRIDIIRRYSSIKIELVELKDKNQKHTASDIRHQEELGALQMTQA